LSRHTQSGRDRRAIRAALHGERPVVQIGRAGLTPSVIAAAREALAAREAIKLKVGQGSIASPREIAEALASALDAEVIAVTGRTLLLYRPAPPDPPDRS